MDETLERKKFESWFEADAYPLEHSNWFRINGYGDYEFDSVAQCWRGWRARAQLEK